MVKSLFSSSKNIENVADLTASLAVVDLGGGKGRYMFVLHYIPSYILMARVNQHPLAHKKKRMVQG